MSLSSKSRLRAVIVCAALALVLSGCGINGAAPVGWIKIDARDFSLFAPPGWTFHRLRGIDSSPGEFEGDGVVLDSEFGEYSDDLQHENPPAYTVIHRSIGGFRARVVSPQTTVHGITGVFFPDVPGKSPLEKDRLCISGRDLTSTQQELVLRIFDTIRFAGKRYSAPPLFRW